MTANISKKRKFVSQGLFYAELNDFLRSELETDPSTFVEGRAPQGDGYAGVEVRVTPTRTEIIIRATNPQGVLGEKGRRIRELTSVIQKRFNLSESAVEVYAERVLSRGLSSVVQAESLKDKLLAGIAVRRACYGVLRYAMESGAKGCEVIVTGKLRAQRAKAMKFREGYMIKTGNPVSHYLDVCTRHVKMKQGVLGVKVSTMLPWDAQGKYGPKIPLPDQITILEPKEDLSGLPNVQ